MSGIANKEPNEDIYVRYLLKFVGKIYSSSYDIYGGICKISRWRCYNIQNVYWLIQII